MTGFALSIDVDPLRRYELLQALHATQHQGGHNGCLECRVFEEVGNPSRVLLSSLWESAEQMQVHLHSDSFHGLRGAIDILGRLVWLHHFEDSAGEGGAGQVQVDNGENAS